MKSMYIFLLVAIVSATGLFAESKKIVLVEQYTSANCQSCGIFDPIYKSANLQYSNDVIPITFHTEGTSGDVLFNHNTQVSRRTLITYNLGTLQIPAVWIDGKKTDINNMSSLSSAIGGMSPVTLKVIENRDADNLNITVGVESDVDMTGYRVFTYIVEDNLNISNAGTSGISNFRWIVRKGYPNDEGAGQPLSIKANGQVAYNYSIKWHPEWKKENIYVVAFVQSFRGDETNFNIIQAAKTGVFEQKPLISSDLTTVDFGEVDTKKTMEVVLHNDGLKEINISEIKLVNNDEDAFSIKFGTSNKKILPFGTAKVNIEFFPKKSGNFTADLLVVSDATNKPNYNVKLKGTAAEILPYGQIASASSLLFGEVSVSKTMDFTISNSGTGPLLISSIAIIDNDFDVYTIDSEELSDITLAVGSTKTFPITFSPKEEGKNYLSEIYIISDSKVNSKLSIPLDGTGKNVQSNANLVLSTGGNSIDFGELEVGKTSSLKIKNNGKTDIQITNINFSDKESGSNDSKAFTLLSSPNTWVVTGMETTVAFKFSPTESKEYNAILNVIAAGDEADLKIDVKATANIASVYGNGLTEKGLLNLNISPNPVSSNSVVEFTNNSQDKLNLVIVNSNGEVVQTLYNGLSKSTERITLNSNVLSNGKYFIIATIADKNEAFSVIVIK